MDIRDALQLAEELVLEHGLEGWTVTFDRAKTRAGACRPARREIGLSIPLTRLHTEAEVRDTILHEVAHALVGVAHHHDAVWRAKAREIGCTGARCVSPEAKRIDGAWVGTCPSGHRITRHQRPTRVASCPQCRPGSFHARHLFTWTHLGQPAAMHPNYLTELRALTNGTAADCLLLGPGTTVRVTAPGPYAGVLGRIQKRGRSRFHVRIPQGVLTVPFALVEPCALMPAAENAWP